MPSLLVCDDVIIYDNRDRPRCQSGWIEVDASLVASSSSSFDITDIDPSIATAFFIGGFVIGVPLWFAAYVVKQIISMFQ